MKLILIVAIIGIPRLLASREHLNQRIKREVSDDEAAEGSGTQGSNLPPIDDEPDSTSSNDGDKKDNESASPANGIPKPPGVVLREDNKPEGVWESFEEESTDDIVLEKGKDSESLVGAGSDGGAGNVTSGYWEFLPADDLSLLIFILLCLILIVIILICCFVLQHMASWAIIKISPDSESSTYENLCVVQSQQSEKHVAQYVVEPGEKEGGVRLLAFTKEPPPRTYSMEQEEAEVVHCATAEVIIAGDDEPKPEYPIIVATLKKDDYQNAPSIHISRPTSGDTRDSWLADVLKKIEHETAEEPDPPKGFNEVAKLQDPHSNQNEAEQDFGSAEPNKTFLEKFGVNDASKKTTTTGPPVSESFSNPHPTEIGKIEKDISRSMDELSLEDELEDYLENSSLRYTS